MNWPTLESAFQWLGERVLGIFVSADRLTNQAHEQSVLFGIDADQATIEKIGRELEESIQAGEGRDQWRERVKVITELRRGQDETIARTAHHRAYIAGQRESLEIPEIADVFPYRRYFATMDNRSRETHRAMHEKVYHKDSELARIAEGLLQEYNCRCSEVPMTEREAMRIGVSSGGENPTLSARALAEAT